MKTITLQMLMLLAIAVITVLGIPENAVAQGWLDPAWNYRKSHLITGAAGAGTDYQVRIIVHKGTGTSTGDHVYLGSYVRDDFADVRFSAGDGTTVLHHWMETASLASGSQAAFWVKVAANLSSNQTIYIYYGNSGANSASNGDNTFILFDDFTEPNLNTAKWTQIGGGTPSFSGGIMTISATNGALSKIIATGIPEQPSRSIVARFQVTDYPTGYSTDDERTGLGTCTDNNGHGYNFVFRRDYNGFIGNYYNYRVQFLDDGISWGNSVGYGWTLNSFFTMEAMDAGNGIWGRVNNGSWLSQPYSGRTGKYSLNIGVVSAETQWDWAFIRKFNTAGEPANSTWGTEQTNYYVWIKTGTANWQDQYNWGPARPDPQAFDILEFVNGETVTATSVPPQTIAQLLVSNNSNITLAGNNVADYTLKVNSVLSIPSDAVLSFVGNLKLGGNLSTITNNGIIRTFVWGSALPNGKTWSGTVEYNANGGAQTVASGTYSNLTISGDNSKTLAGNIMVNGNLNVQSSTAYNAGFTITGTSSKTFTLANGATLGLTGSNHFPSGFGTTTLGSTSMVKYEGASQIIAAKTYGNLTLSGSGIKTAAGSFTMSGNTTLNGITLKSGESDGNNLSMGVLTLGSNSTIALGTGSHTLTFANSSAATWSGNLTITGWQGGWNGTSGTAGIIVFGNNATGLSPAQLSHIWFDDGVTLWPAIIQSTGQVVPCVQIAKVNTISVSGITNTTATCFGTVTDDLGSLVTTKGMVWHTASNPTLDVNTGMTNNGIGLGGFSGDLTGLSSGHTYYVRAYSTNGLGTAYGNEMVFTATGTMITIPAVTTTAASNITNTSASSGGNVTSDGGAPVTARGVCWSMSASPTISGSHTTNGSGTGTFTSAVTGLTPGQTYFIRAYATNSGGTAYGNEVTFTTSAFTCGGSITVNHVAGSVAPVSKNVTYGTVTNIPGETSQCWITRNLGASQQAMAANDATEASAGWYWQFNRKQGYKHDGTTRTPNTTWISSINENLDWQSANDPCSIELGASWRLPTFTEWTNADESGGWTNYNGTYNSLLKIHVAGRLANDDGSLLYRGSGGYYWSSNYTSSVNGDFLIINNGASNVTNWAKSHGFSVRCIRAGKPGVSTSTATPTSQTTAECGGNVTSDGGAAVTARGVCWGISASPTVSGSHTTDGTGTGSFTSSITGLTAGQVYFVRAYATNSEGTAYGNQVSIRIAPPCGTSGITVNHVAGGVAPVTKTVTYSTVTNIPGEPSKCWITRNLGASYLAGSVSDNSENAAGWYWQFNRSQGFKHDGTTVTPAWTTTSISQNSEWIAANDPCALELGTGWRIPTNTEWTNVNASGTWTTWNGPWNSGLKLHAAGHLNSTNGTLVDRGVFGSYFSSTQNGNENGWLLDFNTSTSSTYSNSKAFGFSIRCLRDASPAETTANFNADTTFGGPRTVQFTDLSESSQLPIQWKWYFGDGDSSDVQHPVHQYQHSGSDVQAYTVTLVITDATNVTDTMVKENYIKVTPANYIPAGNVNGVWTAANSPYYIGGEIVVPFGDTLTLEPGVCLKFRTNSTDLPEMTEPPTRENTDFGFMTVYGTLIAQGTAADTIVFTRMGSEGRWGLIHLTNTANAGNPIKYCKIEHASYLNASVSPLTELNWTCQSTPFSGTGVLTTTPDHAQFIKDFTLNTFSTATLSLGFDDGCRVWLNDSLAFDYHMEAHPVNHWNTVVNVAGLLQPGRNRIAVEVYNGVYAGSSGGGFDCQLMVDGVEIIKRGDLYHGQPEAMWYFYGMPGQTLTPPFDQNGLAWFEKDYGIAGAGTLTKEIAGLSLDGNATTVTNSRFCNNLIGIQCDSSQTMILNNQITSNGTGIICNHSNPLIEYNTIPHNESGIGCYQQSNPLIKHNVIASNANAGINVLSGSGVTAVSNTLVHNDHGLYVQTTDSIRIDNSILWYNVLGNVKNIGSKIKIKNSCVEGGDLLNGNITANPLFTGTPANPYGLTWSNFPVKTNPLLISPCINTGNPNLNGTGGNWLTDPADRDPDMSWPDMGACYYHQVPLVTDYNQDYPNPNNGQYKYHHFGNVQIPNQSTFQAFVVRNDADRLNNCQVYFTDANPDQFQLLNPADSLVLLQPYGSDTVKVFFQPTNVGDQYGKLTVGNPGEYTDSLTLVGSGMGTGTVEGHVKTPTGVGVSGVTITIVRTSPAPVVTFSTTTNADGYYTLTNVGYGTFTITPSMSPIPHTFNPPSQPVTLANTNPVTRDFTDVSFFTVSGTVYYLNTINCPSGNRQILLDNMPVLPDPVYTQANGNYTLEVAIGTHTFKPDTALGHSFTPASITRNITNPVSDVHFQDNFTHNLSGYVTGGCGIPLADSVELTVECVNECKDTITVFTDSTGYYSINLPPYQYYVTPTTFDYHGTLITFPMKQADLRERDTVQDFTYHSDPEIDITGFEDVTNQHGWIILQQFEPYQIGIDVYEPYYGPDGNIIRCRVDMGNIVILDDLGDAGQVTVPVSDTTTFYAFHAGLPNIAGGGAHAYQKRLQVQYVNSAKTVVTEEIWAYIVGQRPRETAFTTTTPEIPLLILRDPPGDQSYSYLSQTTQFSQAIGFGMKHGSGSGSYATVSLGADFESETGFFFSVSTNIDVTLDFTAGIDISMSQNSVTENQLTFITNSTYTTSADENVVGRKGDLYMGGAMNLLYGITDILSIVDTVISVTQDIIIVPDGFATTYIYSESYIENTIIPSLYLIGDIASANRWESFITLNQNLKNDAVFTENISFDAGITYSYSETMEKTSTHTQEFEMLVDEKVALDAGLTINGMGGSGGYYVSTSYSTGKSVVNTTVNTTEIGYQLGDNDPGDGFTVDIKRDRVYGTPVFETKSGFSSCPYEENTVPRQGSQLNPRTFAAFEVPPGDPAVFNLFMNNTSQTDEEWDYELSVVNTTNPYGATITAGGQSLSTPINYTLPANTMTSVTIYIYRPFGPVYDMTGIKLKLSSPCESGPGLSDTATFNAHFIPPCSPVSIFSPGNNWVINQANNNILQVTINDYVLTNTQLQQVCLEYSPDYGNNWIEVFSILKDSIQTSFLEVNWDVTGYNDGDYLLRAVSKCAGDINNYSLVRAGHIDIHPPQVVGTPQPSDGVLVTGDEISFSFNEALEPATVTINNCKLVNVANGLQVGASVQYNPTSNKITYTMNPGLSYFIENRHLQSVVAGVTDKYDNPLTDTARHSFYVDQGPLHWIPNSFQYAIPENSGGIIFNFNSMLKNDSPNQVFYSVLSPGIITATPQDGYLSAAGGQTNINFLTQTMMPGIARYDTIQAHTLGFPAEKIYVSFYSPGFINFGVMPANLDVSATAGTSTFEVASNLAWSVSDNANWLSEVPSFGYNDKTITVSYNENTTGSDRVATITVKPEGVTLPSLIITVTQSSGSISHLANLPMGWSGLSSYIIPSEPAMDSVFNLISNNLIIVQTMDALYYPGQNINTIGSWQSQDAFKIKTTNACTLIIEGQFESNTTVFVNSGWNLIPVISECVVDVEALFAPVIADLVIVKEVAGWGVFWPAMNINTIGYLQPGKAYYLLMNETGNFQYPSCEKLGNMTWMNPTLTGFQTFSELGFYIQPAPSTHTIAILPSAIEAFEPGTLIGAYDQAGNCFGITEMGEENNYITIFGNDPTTVEKDGFIDGEVMFFQTLTGLNPTLAGLSGLEATFDQSLPQSDGTFTDNGLSAITRFKASAGIAGVNFFQHVTIFPNPSDGLVTISGLMPGALISISDLHGKAIAGFETQSELSSFDLTNLQPGVYLVKIETSGQLIFRKLILQ